MDLNGKVAVVTGGGGGIGGAVVQELARRGASVVVNDRPAPDGQDRSAAQQVADEVAAAGGAALVDHHNIATWDGAQGLIDAAVERFGSVDVLVMCAGNNIDTPLLQLTEAEWDQVMSVHLKGHVACAAHAARAMVAQGAGGCIVTFSSRAAFLGMNPTYPAAKAGIMGLTAAMAKELAPHGITVNCILPSAQTNLFPARAEDRPDAGGLPRSQHVDPAAIAPVVAYLTGAADITGRFIYAAGGDVCFYEPPLQVANRPVLLHHASTWTAEELAQAVPALLGTTAAPAP